MAYTFHRFAVGGITCTALSDFSRERQDRDTSPFVGVDNDTFRAAVDAWLAATNDPRTVMGGTCLLIDTGQQRVLVDTGNGEDDPQGGGLFRHLAAAGIAPESIDVVVITHAHGDHIAGLRRSNGEIAFPNARHIISRIEWSHWTTIPADADEATRQRRGSVSGQLAALGDRLERIAMDDEIVPGVRAVPAGGHSPGQIAVEAGSGDERLLFIADVAHAPLQLGHPEWYLAFDHDPQAAIATRRAIFSRAASGGLAMAYHFPFPGLGRVVPDGDVWRWESAVTAA